MYFTHTKRLIGALAVSGFLNIILLTSIFYWTIKERSPALYCEQKPAYKQKQQAPQVLEETSSHLIHRMKTFSYDQLVTKLKSTLSIDNGYTERDLALACLVAFHHFDLSRALGSSSFNPQERLIAYGRHPNGSSAVIKIYPALSEAHFSPIIAFATTEKWPQTPQGLFLLLQHKNGKIEPSLLDAFYMTPEFLMLETLFRRQEFPIEKSEIASFLLQGDWKMLENIYEQQRQYGDFSDSFQQNVLLAYAKKKSQTAANLLLKKNGLFAVKKLEDAQVLTLLEALLEKTPESEKFATAILMSPRSDAVRKLAATRLYAYAGETVPDQFQYRKALQRFVTLSKDVQIKGIEKPSAKPLLNKTKTTPIAAKPLDTIKKMVTAPKCDRLYIIQEGDNLWKLSRRFNLDVDLLKNYNKLSSDALVPGSALRIPSS